MHNKQAATAEQPIEPKTVERRPPRLASADIQLLAKIDRLLRDADVAVPGSSKRILTYLCDGRGMLTLDVSKSQPDLPAFDVK